MAEQCQHLTATERYRHLHIFKKLEDLFNAILGKCNTTQVNL